MTDTPPPERRRTPGRRVEDRPGDLAAEVAALRRAVNTYRRAIERKIKLRTWATVAAVVLLALLVVANALVIRQTRQSEDELRHATAEAVLLECEKRKRLEAGLVIFLEETLSTTDPARRDELLELAGDVLSTRPCAALAEPIEPQDR